MVALPHPRTHAALLALLLIIIRFTAMAPTAADDDDDDEGARELLDLLQRVQSEAQRALGPADFDPKLYVDLPLATSARAAADALAALPRPVSRADLEAYVARHFGAAGSDLVAADPPDFAPDPPGFLPRVESREARAWALDVHALWKDLARRVAPAVAARPERHTLLPLPGGVVVPGSRFREVYYWDSYWVIRSGQIDPPRFHLISALLFAPLSSHFPCPLLPSNTTIFSSQQLTESPRHGVSFPLQRIVRCTCSSLYR